MLHSDPLITAIASVASLPKGDVVWSEVLRTSVRYMGLRMQWGLALSTCDDLDAARHRIDLDQSRTAAHDAVIDALNAVSRLQSAHGIRVDWRRDLGDMGLPENRKRAGDLACRIALDLALWAR